MSTFKLSLSPGFVALHLHSNKLDCLLKANHPALRPTTIPHFFLFISSPLPEDFNIPIAMCMHEHRDYRGNLIRCDLVGHDSPTNSLMVFQVVRKSAIYKHYAGDNSPENPRDTV